MSLQKKLLGWFQTNQRPLPWRKNYHPYEVWISEIMLQQTQMDTVLPYFNRWMRDFPSLKALAQADEKKVLKLWEGLGYYSRARNLHFTAKQIVEKHGGEFPSDYETILSLKGIGRYTAGAISSIAFNQNRPIVDGNVLRVLSRLFALKDPIDGDKSVFWILQEKLIPKGRAREFNQGLMELGALICRSHKPLCSQCPVSHSCQAFKSRTQEHYPVKSKKKTVVKVEACAVVIEKKGKFFLHRRPVGKIMGGLWEFPEWKVSRNKISELLWNDFEIKTGKIESIEKIKRNYTHHSETLYVFRLKLPATVKLLSKNGWESAWVSKVDFKKYPFSSAHAKIAKRYLSPIYPIQITGSHKTAA